MKLIFMGDCMFGRNHNLFIENPFINIEDLLKRGSHLFFNLETTISPVKLTKKRNKHFTYQSTGEQLIYLRKLLKKKPIFVSISNNHSLDFGVESHISTKKFLKKYNYLCNSKNKVEANNIIFLNATDHCGCEHPEYWKEQILMIDYNNTEKLLQRIQNIRKNTTKIIVFSIHWGSNWIPDEMPSYIKEFGRKLIDNGVSIVYGHSAHHIPKNNIETYKDGIIIYGLGDLINDYSVKEEYKSDKAQICIITKINKKLSYKLIPIKRKFVENNSSIPFYDDESLSDRPIIVDSS